MTAHPDGSWDAGTMGEISIRGPYRDRRTHPDGYSEPPKPREAREQVDCDEGCGAFKVPANLDEARAALTHWAEHGLDFGCSHGR